MEKISGSEDEGYLKNNDKRTDNNSDTEKLCPADGTQFSERISVSLVASILEKAAGMLNRPSTRKKFNRSKTKCSTKYIEQLVRHTIQRCKLRKSEILGRVSSHSNSSNCTIPEVRKNLMAMISTENYANSEQGCAYSNLELSKTETIIRLLEDAVKDMQ